MYDISDKGWCDQAKQIISPNYNDRPVDMGIDAIIIHSISLPPNCYQGNDISHFFTNQLDCDSDPFYPSIAKLKVSAHFLIRRTGELLQYVSVYSRAWHAGISELNQQDNCNDFSIGIELEGTDTSLFETVQYITLAQLVMSLQHHFPKITEQRIVGHSDIAPKRKTDPGIGFDWQQWRIQLQQLKNKKE
jgi:AmpD protein